MDPTAELFTGGIALVGGVVGGVVQHRLTERRAGRQARYAEHLADADRRLRQLRAELLLRASEDPDRLRQRQEAGELLVDVRELRRTVGVLQHLSSRAMGAGRWTVRAKARRGWLACAAFLSLLQADLTQYVLAWSIAGKGGIPPAAPGETEDPAMAEVRRLHESIAHEPNQALAAMAERLADAIGLIGDFRDGFEGLVEWSEVEPSAFGREAPSGLPR